MKKLILIMSVFLFACQEEITPVPNESKSQVLEISGNQYTEVKISGFGSVWVDGKNPVLIKVSKGILTYTACGVSGEFNHDGKSKLVIECP